VNRRFLFAAGAALAILLAACGGGGGGGAVPATHLPGTTSLANVPSQLLVQSWGQSAMTGATYVGPLANASLNVSVLVHQQAAQALQQYAQDVSNPSSGNFRKFLTPDQLATRFGATQTSYQAVAQYFVNNGLAVAGWKQRMLLTVSGSQANMQKAFGTTFAIYQHNGTEFVAPMSQPHFTQQLAVDEVGNIVRVQPDRRDIVPPEAGAGFSTGYSPSTVRAAFDYIGAYESGFDGNGIVVGIVGTGPIDTTSSGHGDVDLNTYLADTQTANAATVTEKVVTNEGVTTGLATSCPSGCSFPFSGGSFASPPPVTSSCSGSLPACNPEDSEAQLDTQQAATLAPGASVFFYLAYNAADCSGITYPSPCPSAAADAGPEIGIDESDPEIQQAISDNQVDVLSLSFGGGEIQQGWTGYEGASGYVGSFSQLEFAALAAEGIAVFAASGDNGSAECSSGSTYLPEQCVSYPAGDPNVTSVGGVTLNVNAFGQTTAPWLAWGISTSESGFGGREGSGGGISGVPIPAPSWQAGSPIGATDREQPDVSMIGDPRTGVSLVTNAAFGGGISGIGGTSVATPEMAAMWADVLSACKANPSAGACASGGGSATPWRLGNAAPYLYAILKHTSIGSWTPALAYDQVFYDVVYGDNQMTNPNESPASPIPGASAVPGYDLVTGIGVPYAGHLIDAITGLNVP
jgi:subtilase family serine protease